MAVTTHEAEWVAGYYHGCLDARDQLPHQHPEGAHGDPWLIGYDAGYEDGTVLRVTEPKR